MRQPTAEQLAVPFALKTQVGQLRSQATGEVLDLAAGNNLSQACRADQKGADQTYDTICSVGALATAENLSELAAELLEKLAEGGKLLFIEPESDALNPDITLTLWNAGFTVLNADRFHVPGTAPLKGKWWLRGRRTAWHKCVTGAAHRRIPPKMPSRQR